MRQGLLILSVVLVGCNPPKDNPAIKAVDNRTQNGGTLHITGSGFNPGFPVSVGVLNVPGATTWSQKAGKATNPGGTIDVTVTYTFSGALPPLPGCGSGNNVTTSLNVTGTDDSTHNFGATTVDVLNCGWATPQVTNHQ